MDLDQIQMEVYLHDLYCYILLRVQGVSVEMLRIFITKLRNSAY